MFFAKNNAQIKTSKNSTSKKNSPFFTQNHKYEKKKYFCSLINVMKQTSLIY